MDAGQEAEPEARARAAPCSGEGKDFLQLEGGPGKRLRKKQEPENTATVVYVGHRIGFFRQFGTVKRLRIARNRKTGKSKHYGFIEFESPDVAKVASDTMNNYLLFEYNLQTALVPREKVHRKLWKGVCRGFTLVDRVAIQRRRQNKDRTVTEHKKMVEGIVKRDEKRRKRIKVASIDYECPALVGSIPPEAKRIKFDED